MRTAAFIRIIIFVAVAVICILLLVFGLVKGTLGRIRVPNMGVFNNNTYNWGSDEGYKISSGEKINASNIKSINVDWINGNVLIEEYDGETVQFFEENNSRESDLQMRYQDTGGVLNIRFARSGNINLGLFNNLIKKLTVLIPRDMNIDYLRIDAVSASVKVQGVNVNSLKVDTTSGDVTIDNAVSETIDIDTVSGRIEITETETYSVDLDSISGNHKFQGECERFKSNTTSGDVTVYFEIPIKDADFDTISGSITVYLTEQNGFTARWDSISGRFNCDFATTFQGDSATYGDGSASIRMNNVSGRMSIKRI